jgi:hypothetical protein
MSPEFLRPHWKYGRSEVRHLVRLLNTLPKGLIVGYVHDNDAATQKIMLQGDLDLAEYLDPGHARKAIIKAIRTSDTSDKEKNPITGKPCCPLGFVMQAIVTAFIRMRERTTLSLKQKYEAIMDLEIDVCCDLAECDRDLLPFACISFARYVLHDGRGAWRGLQRQEEEVPLVVVASETRRCNGDMPRIIMAVPLVEKSLDRVSEM